MATTLIIELDPTPGESGAARIEAAVERVVASTNKLSGSLDTAITRIGNFGREFLRSQQAFAQVLNQQEAYRQSLGTSLNVLAAQVQSLRRSSEEGVKGADALERLTKATKEAEGFSRRYADTFAHLTRQYRELHRDAQIAAEHTRKLSSAQADYNRQRELAQKTGGFKLADEVKSLEAVKRAQQDLLAGTINLTTFKERLIAIDAQVRGNNEALAKSYAQLKVEVEQGKNAIARFQKEQERVAAQKLIVKPLPQEVTGQSSPIRHDKTEIANLQAQIALQNQVIQGDLSRADAARKLAVIQETLRTGNVALAETLVDLREEAAKGEKAVNALEAAERKAIAAIVAARAEAQKETARVANIEKEIATLEREVAIRRRVVQGILQVADAERILAQERAKDRGFDDAQAKRVADLQIEQATLARQQAAQTQQAAIEKEIATLQREIDVKERVAKGTLDLAEAERILAIERAKSRGATDDQANRLVVAQEQAAAQAQQQRLQAQRQASTEHAALLQKEIDLKEKVVRGTLSLVDAEKMINAERLKAKPGADAQEADRIATLQARLKQLDATIRELTQTRQKDAAAAARRSQESQKIDQDIAAIRRDVEIKEAAVRGTIRLAEAEKRLAQERANARAGISRGQADELGPLLARQAEATRRFGQAQRDAERDSRGFNERLKETAHSIRRIAELATGISIVSVIGRTFRETFEQIKKGFDISNELERNKIAIASLLQGTTEIKNGLGEIVSGTQAWGINLAEAKALQVEIAKISAETLGTDIELLDVFRTALSFSRGQKAELSDMLKLAQGITNVGKLQGLEATRLTDETRQILQLESNRGQTILAQLGISIQQARVYKEQGNLVQKLVEAFGAYNELAEESALTFDGLKTSIETFSNLFRASVFAPAFDAIKQVMIGMRDELDALRQSGGITAAIGASGDDLRNLGKALADIFAIIQVSIVSLLDVILILSVAFTDASKAPETFEERLKTLNEQIIATRDYTLDTIETFGELVSMSKILTEAILALVAGLLLLPFGKFAALLGIVGGTLAGKKLANIGGDLAEAARATREHAQANDQLNRSLVQTVKETENWTQDQKERLGVFDEFKRALRQAEEDNLTLTESNMKVAESYGLITDRVKLLATFIPKVADEAIPESLSNPYAGTGAPFVPDFFTRTGSPRDETENRKFDEFIKKMKTTSKELIEFYARTTGDAQKFAAQARKEALDAYEQDVKRLGTLTEEQKTQLESQIKPVAEASAQKDFIEEILKGIEKVGAAQLEQAQAQQIAAQAAIDSQRLAAEATVSRAEAEEKLLEGLDVFDQRRIDAAERTATARNALRDVNIAASQAEAEAAKQNAGIVQGIIDKFIEQRAQVQELLNNLPEGTQPEVGATFKGLIALITQQIQGAQKELAGFQATAAQGAAELGKIQAQTLEEQARAQKQLIDNRLKGLDQAIDKQNDLNRAANTDLDIQKQLVEAKGQRSDDRRDILEAELDLIREQGGSIESIIAREAEILAILRQQVQNKIILAEIDLKRAQNNQTTAGNNLAAAQAEAAAQAQQFGQASLDLQQRIVDLQDEYKRRTIEVGQAQLNVDSAKAAAYKQELVARNKILELQKEAAKNALLSVSDVRGFFDNFITGIQQGNQKLGKILTDFGQSISAKFFKQLLIGKNDNFDAPIIDNVSGLFGQNGIIGQIMGQGGSSAFSSFFSGFQTQATTAGGGSTGWFPGATGGGGGGLTSMFGDFFGFGGQSFSSFDQGFDASKAEWSAFDPSDLSANGGAITNNGQGFSEAGSSAGLLFAAAAVAQIGKSFADGNYGAGAAGAVGAGIGAFFGGPQGAAIGAQIGSFIGSFFDNIFNQPGRIQVEKEKMEKFFGEVFGNMNFKIVKEKAAAEGFAAYKEGTDAALALGAIYARSVGEKATQGTIVRFAGQLLGNFDNLGVGAEQAKEKIMQLAEAMGADLATAIDTINGLTRSHSEAQGNDLLSIKEFEEEIEEARKNLKKYGDTSQLTAKQLSELATANGNTGSNIVTYGQLITGAIQINTDFADSVLVATQVNRLLADQFLEVVTAQGQLGDQTQRLADEIRSGNLSVEEAIVAYNDLRKAAGLAKVELDDFTLDPKEVERLAKIIGELTKTFETLRDNLGQGLGDALSSGLDPSKYAEAFDNLFNETLKNSIVNAIVLGFTEGTAIEALKPFFDEINALLVDVATGGSSLDDFSDKLNASLAKNKDAIEAVKDAWVAAGQAGTAVLEQFMEGSASTEGLASSMADALTSGLNEGLDPSKYEAKFNELFKTMLRESIVSAIVSGFAEGLSLTSLEPFFDKFQDLMKQRSENLISTADLQAGVDDLLSQFGPELQRVRSLFTETAQESAKVLRTLGLWPSELEEAEQKLEDINDRLKEIAQRKIDIEVTYHQRLADIGFPGGELEAVNFESGFLNDQLNNALKKPGVSPGSQLPDVNDPKAVEQFNEDITEAMDLIRQLGDLEVQRFHALEQQINDRYEQEVEGIRKAAEAEEKSIRDHYEGLLDASKARVRALQDEKDAIQDTHREQIEALKEQLQLIKEFAQVGERIRDSIIGIVGSNQNPGSPHAQFAFLERQAQALREQLATAAPEDQPDLINRLAEILQQQLSLDVFQRPSGEYKELFNKIVGELEKLRDQALAAGQGAEAIEDQIKALEEEQKALLESIDAKIEAEQDLQRQIADEQEAALEALAARTEAAILAAEAGRDAAIADLRDTTAARLAELRDQELALAERAEGFLLTEKQIMLQQLEVLRSIDSKIGGTGTGTGTNAWQNPPEAHEVPAGSSGLVGNGPSSNVSLAPPGNSTTPSPDSHPAPAYNGIPVGFDFKSVPGLDWDGDSWKEVKKNADVVWWQPTNTYYYQGQALSQQQFEWLAQHGPSWLNGPPEEEKKPFAPGNSATFYGNDTLPYSFNASGFSGVVDKPHAFIAGEAGPEMVQIIPLADAPSAPNASPIPNMDQFGGITAMMEQQSNALMKGNKIPWDMGYSFNANGFSGLVTEPHAFIAAEKEPEFVDIAPQANSRNNDGNGDVNVNLPLNLTVQIVGEISNPEAKGKAVATTIAREHQKLMAQWAKSTEGRKILQKVAK